MKHLIIIAIVLCSLTSMSQTVTNPPDGSALVTSYLAPNGLIYTGSIPKQFRVMASSQNAILDNKTNTPEAKRISVSDSIKTTGVVRGTLALFGNVNSTLPLFGKNSAVNAISAYTDPTIERIGISSSYEISKTTAPTFNWRSSAVEGITRIGALNTQDWQEGGTSKHPVIMGFAGTVNVVPGSSGFIPKGSIYYGTAGGAGLNSGARFGQFNMVDLTYGHSLDIDYASGIRITDLDLGKLGNTFLFMNNGDTIPLPLGNYGIYQDITYPNYFGTGNSLFGSNVNNGSKLQVKSTSIDAVPTFTIDGTQTAGSDIAAFNYNGSKTSSISTAGQFRGAALVNIVSQMNANVGVSATGTVISRNVADAATALTINQTNVGSTGPILDLRTMSNNSIFRFEKSGIISLYNTPLSALQSFRTNAAGTASEAFTPATTTDISNLSTVYAPITGSVNYIQKSPSTAQPASINITGTINSSSIFSTGSVSGTSLSSSGGIQSATDITAIGSVIGASGSFSGNVSGATPTLSTHLGTKGYIDNLGLNYVKYGNNGSGFGGNTGIAFGNDNSYFQAINTAGNAATSLTPLGLTIQNNNFSTKLVAAGTNTTTANVSVRNTTGVMALTSDITANNATYPVNTGGETLNSAALRGRTIITSTSGITDNFIMQGAQAANGDGHGFSWTNGTNTTGRIRDQYNAGSNTTDIIFSHLFNGTYQTTDLMTLKGNGNLGIGTGSPASKITVAAGDVETTSSANGFILTAPNGSRWRVTVSNTGVLTTTAL